MTTKNKIDYEELIDFEDVKAFEKAGEYASSVFPLLYSGIPFDTEKDDEEWRRESRYLDSRYDELKNR